MGDDNKTSLFGDVLGEMLLAEKQSGGPGGGARKREVVLGLLIDTGVMAESQKDSIGLIIDLIVFCAHHAADLKQLVKSSGCLPCLR